MLQLEQKRTNLIAPASIPDEDFEKFHTELKQALKYVKYSSDKNKLKQMVDKDESYSHISRKTADMINIVTGSELEYETGKDEVNMCKAIQEIKEDARLEANIETAKKVLALGKLTLEEVAEIYNLSIDDVKKLASEA